MSGLLAGAHIDGGELDLVFVKDWEEANFTLAARTIGVIICAERVGGVACTAALHGVRQARPSIVTVCIAAPGSSVDPSCAHVVLAYGALDELPSVCEDAAAVARLRSRER